jgi:NAD(P)-dependent dehydrogenase (short-subunit alcohol dehydrogenase family)
VSHPFSLEGLQILITGASGGLGRATAILAGRMGAKLVLTGRNRDRLEETRALVPSDGHHIEPRDLKLTGEIPAWLKQLTVSVGRLHGLVHAAGIQIVRPLRMADDAALNEMMAINVNAAFALVKGFRQRGVVGEAGSIVLLSSVMGITGQAGQALYSASKGALISMCRSAAVELARDKIRINCIAPGLVKTEMAEQLKSSLSAEQVQAVTAMHPLGLAQPADVAGAAVFLLSPAAGWITGTTLVVDGGYTAH